MKILDAQKLKIDAVFYISRDLPISEIVEKSPKAVELLSLYGLHCTNCFFNSSDTIENGAKMHGMGEEEIDAMVSEINNELAKEQNGEPSTGN